ncbi:unnamed protein product, partial [Rotaria socialis]
MGCTTTKIAPQSPQPKEQQSYNDDDIYNIQDDSVFSPKNIAADDNIIANIPDKSDHVHIQVADSQAFNDSFVQQRQQAINNRSYQTTVQSWQPKSLQQLAELIKAFSKGKSLVDRHWIIFYWIACNIDYDT